MPTYLARRDVFSPQELDEIERLANTIPGKPTPVGQNEQVNRDVNRSVYRHLMPANETVWIYERLADAVSVMNARGFHFDISGFDEPLFHVSYEGKDKGHYSWHADKPAIGNAMRKLSITVQLSDPSDYSDGELELNLAGDPLIAPKDRGAVVLFPSFCMHRVRPVTKGKRSSLIAWVVGPPLR